MKPKSLAFSIINCSLLFFIFAIGLTVDESVAKELYSPYLKIATVNSSVSDVATQVKDALAGGNFDVIGEYNPEGKAGLHVIVYTRKDLQDITLTVEDRGFLASVLKVGLQENKDGVDVSMLNPEYLFRGYLMKKYPGLEDQLKKVDADAKEALKKVGGEFTPFGGKLSAKRLEHYHYKITMEYFDEPVSLRKFDSFEQGVETIRKNLEAKVGGAFSVYSLVRDDAKTALFGIGLGDKETGESYFLPRIGPKHLAALPYEIILSDTDATMLHGRFRIALHWPELSMFFGEYSFAKIMSTPKAIEKTMKEVTN
ncbi:MAG: hypothetical protein V3S46_03295 [Nitrospinota bacterium]